MKHRLAKCAFLAALAGCGGDGATGPPPGDEPAFDKRLSAGSATVFDVSSVAFESPIPTLVGADFEKFLAGDAAFEATFVTPPADVNPGVGSVYNHTSCVGCHVRDGRGAPSFGTEPPFTGSLLMRVSLSGTDPDVPNGPMPVPGFGVQIQDRASFGVAPEGRVLVTGFDEVVTLADGETVVLRVPAYDIVDTYMPLPAGVLTSPRIAPPVFGRGLLEAIPEGEILSRADPGDADGDGISGKPNYAYNARSGRVELGRFGWKANNPTVLQQSAGAYNQDMGVTSTYFPVESMFGQSQHDGLLDDPELPAETLEVTTFYVQTLGVPARRDVDDPDVLRGEALFESAGCADCHTPIMRTGNHSIAAISNIVIQPFSDLLLHDMGPGLADGRPDFDATGDEWRTPPLWGIGLTETVGGVAAYLHDGRASTLLEAIFFHGGEAQTARDSVVAMVRQDRDALVLFLRSL